MTISRERTTYAQFALRDGQQADDCPQLLSAEIAGLTAADPRDALHIICEPVEPTPRAAHIVVAMMAAIRDAYAESDRSDPIAAIAAAVEAANDVLYTKNRAGAPNLRVFLGVTCLVIRDRDLAICQVPPTQAIVAQNGTPIALPELASWRGDYQPRAGDPYLGHEGPHGLGMHAEALPLLFRASLEPGDLITLCSSNLAALLADEELAPLVGDDPGAARDALVALARRHRLDGAYAAVIEPPLPEFPAAITGAHRPEPLRRVAESDDIDDIDDAVDHYVAGTEGDDEGDDAAPPSWIERGLREVREMRDRVRVIAWPRKQPRARARIVPLRSGIAIDAAGFDGADEPDRDEGPGFGGRAGAELSYTVRRASDLWTATATATPRADYEGEYRGLATLSLYSAPSAPNDAWADEADDGALDDEAAAEGEAGLADDDPTGDWEEAGHRAREGRGAGRALSGAGALLLLLAGSLLDRDHPAGRRRLGHGQRVDFPLPDGAIPDAGRRGRARPDRVQAERVLPIGSLERWRRRRVRLLAPFVVLATVVAVAALALVVSHAARDRQVRAAENRFTAALADVSGRREGAVASRDRLAAHAQLLALRESLDALATDGHPQWQERVAAERQALAQALDRVDGVERLGAGQVELLAPSPVAVGATASRPQLVVAMGQQYLLLDGTVYGVDGRGKTTAKLLAKGDKVGEVAVGQLIGLAWRIDKLLAFDEGRAYLRDADGSWGALPLAAAGLKPAAADTFDGNLYLLTPDRGQIVKFASGAYAAAPQPWSSPKANGDLALATDLAIDKDIYALLSDGRVLDLYQGEQKGAYAPATVPPLAGASALRVAPDGQYLYVVDPNEGRIVRLTRDGNVVGVYKAAPGAPAFTGAREIAVDEAANVAYLLADDGLLAVHLPAPR